MDSQSTSKGGGGWWHFAYLQNQHGGMQSLIIHACTWQVKHWGAAEGLCRHREHLQSVEFKRGPTWTGQPLVLPLKRKKKHQQSFLQDRTALFTGTGVTGPARGSSSISGMHGSSSSTAGLPAPANLQNASRAALHVPTAQSFKGIWKHLILHSAPDICTGHVWMCVKHGRTIGLVLNTLWIAERINIQKHRGKIKKKKKRKKS